MYSLNNITTGDSYDEDNTLDCPGTNEVTLQVANAAIYISYALPIAGNTRQPGSFGTEVFILPGFHVYPIRCEQVRVRSAVSGTPAQVTIQAL